MKRRLWNQKREHIGICAAGVLLALGLMIGFRGATPVEAAEKIPISSAEDLMNMENDPDGNYYLTQDITLPKNMPALFNEYGAPFTGTLDGNGHKLKNYTYKVTNTEREEWAGVYIFGLAENATIKNLSLTNVNVDINGYGHVCTLVAEATNCKFDKIKISGKITLKGNCRDGIEYSVGGLIGIGKNCKVTNCSGSLKIKVSGETVQGCWVGGLARDLYGETGSVKNCSFSGDISVNGITPDKYGGLDYHAAGICASFSETLVSGCKNSGNITLKVKKGGADQHQNGFIEAYGIGGGEPRLLSSCGNSGKIKISASKIKDDVRAAGLVDTVHNGAKTTITKCWNTGSVSATGAGRAHAAGICRSTSIIVQSYNKGAVSASGYKGIVERFDADAGIDRESEAGGLCVYVYQMRNCYNVGNISMNGTGQAAGLATDIYASYGTTTNNYSTGTITAKGGSGVLESEIAAALFTHYDGAGMRMDNKCYIYDNYYSGCKRAYGSGIGDSPGSKVKPKATKISSVTSKSCPKLSSKYWTYSTKYKRMILKNNKER